MVILLLKKLKEQTYEKLLHGNGTLWMPAHWELISKAIAGSSCKTGKSGGDRTEHRQEREF